MFLKLSWRLGSQLVQKVSLSSHSFVQWPNTKVRHDVQKVITKNETEWWTTPVFLALTLTGLAIRSVLTPLSVVLRRWWAVRRRLSRAVFRIVEIEHIAYVAENARWYYSTLDGISERVSTGSKSGRGLIQAHHHRNSLKITQGTTYRLTSDPLLVLRIPLPTSIIWSRASRSSFFLCMSTMTEFKKSIWNFKNIFNILQAYPLSSQ